VGNSDSPLTGKSPEMLIGNSLSVRLVLGEADAVGVGGRSLGVLGLLGDQLDASVAALGNSDGL
jgi:hypothetical protein